MFELIGLAATGVLTAVGYFKTRDFVQRRLRFVEFVQKGFAPVVVGAGAAVVAVPAVALLPIVGVGTAILFGAGVGAGVAAGAHRIRNGRLALPD